MEDEIVGTILDDFETNDDSNFKKIPESLPTKSVSNLTFTAINSSPLNDLCSHIHFSLPDILANVSPTNCDLSVDELKIDGHLDKIRLNEQPIGLLAKVEIIPSVKNFTSNIILDNNKFFSEIMANNSLSCQQNNSENYINSAHLYSNIDSEIPNGIYNPFMDVGISLVSESCQIHHTTNNSATHSIMSDSHIPYLPKKSDSSITISLNKNGQTETTSISSINMPHRINSMLGYEKPFWIPDDQADACLYCDQKFTIVRRRHHCRACGKILCSTCCNKRLMLPSMDFKPSRVCTACFQLLNNDLPCSSTMSSSLTDEDHEDNNTNVEISAGKISVTHATGASKIVTASLNQERFVSQLQSQTPPSNQSPNPLRPEEYCSTISPLIQVQTVRPKQPPIVYVPVVGVLKNTTPTCTNSVGQVTKALVHSQHAIAGSSCSKKKHVMFSDGIRPGGDLSLLDDLMASSCTLSNPSCGYPSRLRTSPHGRNRSKRINSQNKNGGTKFGPGVEDPSSTAAYFIVSALNYVPTLVLEFKFPPSPIEDDYRFPILIVSEHLKIKATLISLTCCLDANHSIDDERQFENGYICLTTQGMRNVGIDEILAVFFLPLRLREQAKEIVKSKSSNKFNAFNPVIRLLLEFGYQMHQLFIDALNGNRISVYGFLPLTFVSDKDYGMIFEKSLSSNGQTLSCNKNLTEVTEGESRGFWLQNSKLHSGFLLFPPCHPFHCLQNLLLPPGDEPFQFALLVHRWETPWAKMLPLRLLLRLGFEFKTYPYPFVSILDRKSTFYEINHTIINLLADSRNFKYTLPRISGFYISIECKTVTLNVCRENLKEVLNIIGQSTISDHVLAFAGNFNTCVGAHLVCVQDESSGQYSTESFACESREPNTTGATFLVFNGSLKENALTSKSTVSKMDQNDIKHESFIRISLVEDGIIVHVTPQNLAKIASALKSMVDLDLGVMNPSDQRSVALASNKILGDDASMDYNLFQEIHSKSLTYGIKSNEIDYFPDDEWAFDDMPSTNFIPPQFTKDQRATDQNCSTLNSYKMSPSPKEEDTIINLNGKEKDRLIIRWIDGQQMERAENYDKKKFNIYYNRGLRSLIDGIDLQNVSSIRPFNLVDYVKGSLMVRLVEIYYIKTDAIFMAKSDSLDPDKLAESLSKAFSSCIVHRLNLLTSANVFRVNLRITIDASKVGYEISHLGKEYQPFLTEIDDYLIPVIHSALNYTLDGGGSLIIELLFNILPSLAPSRTAF